MNFTLIPTSQTGWQALIHRMDARLRAPHSTAVA